MAARPDILPGALADAAGAAPLPRAAAAAAASAHAPLFDRLILFIAGVLMTVGVTMVYSASVTLAGRDFDLRRWWDSPLRQCVFAVAAFVGMVFAALVDYRVFAWRGPRGGWRSGVVAGLALLLLIAVLIPGVGAEALGAQRALVVLRSPFTLSFQPSEFAKVALVIWLAALLSRSAALPPAAPPAPRRALPGFTGLGYSPLRPPDADRSVRSVFLPAVLGGGALVALTGLEDFGTAALMGVVMACLLYLGGVKLRYLGALGLLGLLAAAGLVLMKPYRMQRIVTFMSEAPDPSNDGYQVMQALIAIGSGGWWGRGLGEGVQKYGYLPQDNNDFIFAIVCEELGVVGGLAIVALFLLLVARGWWLSARNADPFGRLLAAGLTLTIGLQAAFNIGVVTNSVPTKGISLPFVSAGGSGVVFLCLAAGLLASTVRTLRRGPKAASAAGT